MLEKLIKNLKSPAMKEGLFTAGLFAALIPIRVGIQDFSYSKSNFSKSEKKLLHTQEVIRHTVGTVLNVLGLLLSYEVVVKKFFPNASKLESVLLTTLVSQLPDIILRPAITAKISDMILHHKTNKKKSAKPAFNHHAKATVTAVPLRLYQLNANSAAGELFGRSERQRPAVQKASIKPFINAANTSLRI